MGQVWSASATAAYHQTPSNTDQRKVHWSLVSLERDNEGVEFLVGQNITVHVLCDDIIKPRRIRNAEIIACSCAEDLSGDSSLSRDVMEAAGEKIRQICQSHVDSVGRIPISGYYYTEPGDLANSYNGLKSILYAVSPNPKLITREGNTSGNRNLIKLTSDTYYNCFSVTNLNLKLSSIALPPFGSTTYQISMNVIVEAIIDALRRLDEYLESTGHRSQYLKDIYIVSNRKMHTVELVKGFRQHYAKYLNTL